MPDHHRYLVIEFFNDSDAILNLSISRCIVVYDLTVLNCHKYNIWETTVIFIIVNNRQMLRVTYRTKKNPRKINPNEIYCLKFITPYVNTDGIKYLGY